MINSKHFWADNICIDNLE